MRCCCCCRWLACVIRQGAEEHVMRHTSRITRHTSHVTRHTSPAVILQRMAPLLPHTSDVSVVISAPLPAGMLGVCGCNIRGWVPAFVVQSKHFALEGAAACSGQLLEYLDALLACVYVCVYMYACVCVCVCVRVCVYACECACFSIHHAAAGRGRCGVQGGRTCRRQRAQRRCCTPA